MRNKETLKDEILILKILRGFRSPKNSFKIYSKMGSGSAIGDKNTSTRTSRLLSNLEKSGDVTVEFEGRVKVYKITELGRRRLMTRQAAEEFRASSPLTLADATHRALEERDREKN